MVCESALVLNNLAIDEGICGKQYKNMRSVFFSLLIFLGLTKQKSRANKLAIVSTVQIDFLGRMDLV